MLFSFDREIRQPAKVKLVYDVIKTDLPVIRKALLSACGNALVCETKADARQVGNYRIFRYPSNGVRCHSVLPVDQSVNYL